MKKTSELRKLFLFARPYAGSLLLSCLFMAGVTLFDIFRLSAIIPVIDRIFTNRPIVFYHSKVPAFAQGVIDYLNTREPLQVLILILIVMPAGLIIRAVFEFFQSYVMSDVGQKVIRDARTMVFEKLQVLSLEYFLKKRSGELISRITNDVKLIENAVSYALTDLVYQSLQVVAFAVLTFAINWRLAVISFGVFPLVVYPMARVGKALRKLSRRSQEKIADINSLLVESFIGVRIVRAFCAEAREIARFKAQNHDYYRISMKAIKRMLLVGIITELVGVGMALFVLFYSGRQVISEQLSFGVFALFMAALLSMIKPFKKLSQVNSIMQQAIAASNRIHEVLETPVSVKESPAAAQLEEFEREILFDQVCFRYTEQDVLKNVTIRVKKGAMLAIVGPSGTGKTTLVDLIPRFFDPQKGRILIDGRDIKEVTLASLRRQIGIVTQETILFNDTIEANIAYGNPQASHEEVITAARQAHAHEFISRFPEGYAAVIGDRGMKLSGGERQRIAIARALLKNPPILILDEATSQLDSESERVVQDALDRLVAGRTVFVIAHRLSTVRNAQKIVVLNKGAVAEEGAHEELIRRDGLYKRLYQMQELKGTD